LLKRFLTVIDKFAIMDHMNKTNKTYVDGFVEWFEWQAKQRLKELIAKVLELKVIDNLFYDQKPKEKKG